MEPIREQHATRASDRLRHIAGAFAQSRDQRVFPTRRRGRMPPQRHERGPVVHQVSPQIAQRRVDLHALERLDRTPYASLALLLPFEAKPAHFTGGEREGRLDLREHLELDVHFARATQAVGGLPEDAVELLGIRGRQSFGHQRHHFAHPARCYARVMNGRAMTIANTCKQCEEIVDLAKKKRRRRNGRWHFCAPRYRVLQGAHQKKRDGRMASPVPVAVPFPAPVEGRVNGV